MYEKIPPIVLKTELAESPKTVTSENKKPRQSTILDCSSEPYTYQTLSFDEIKDIYIVTMSNENKVEVQNLMNFLFKKKKMLFITNY